MLKQYETLGNNILQHMSYEEFEALNRLVVDSLLLIGALLVIAMYVMRYRAARTICADFEADGDSRRFQNRVFRFWAIFPFGRKH